MLERMRVDEFLTALLSIVQPLAPLDLPLLDAHGATLADRKSTRLNPSHT